MSSMHEVLDVNTAPQKENENLLEVITFNLHNFPACDVAYL